MTMDAATELESAERGLYSEGFGRTDQGFYNMLLQRVKTHFEDSLTDITRDILTELSQNVRIFVSALDTRSISVQDSSILNVLHQLITSQMIEPVEGSTEQERFEQTENSTAPPEHPVRIEREINALFEEAIEQDFEDGMESEFSRKLDSLIRECGNSAMSEIAHLITRERVSPEVSAEALLCLCDMDHAPTHNYRLWLLERSLSSSSARIRDRAALGLASMSDPHGIPYIKEAIGRETCTELREDMEQVLAELEADHFASLAKEDKQV